MIGYKNYVRLLKKITEEKIVQNIYMCKDNEYDIFN